MKKFLIAMILVALLGCMAGGCTSGENPLEHAQRLHLQKEVQSRQLVEDFDMFWHFNRASRLTMWHGHAGI